MSDASGGMPAGNTEKKTLPDRTLAPTSHTNPTLTAAAAKVIGSRESTVQEASKVPLARQNQVPHALSIAAMKAVGDSLSGNARIKSDMKRTEALQRLLRSTKDAAAEHKQSIEAYNGAVNQYFDRGRGSRGGEVLDKIIRQNGMSRAEAVKAVSAGRAEELGVSPADAKAVATHVQGANKDSSVRKTLKTMVASGAMLSLFSERMASSEHSAYATGTTMDKHSLPHPETFGNEAESAIHAERGDVEPMDIGNSASKAKSPIDIMEEAVQDNLETGLEQFGEAASTFFKLGR